MVMMLMSLVLGKKPKPELPEYDTLDEMDTRALYLKILSKEAHSSVICFPALYSLLKARTDKPEKYSGLAYAWFEQLSRYILGSFSANSRACCLAKLFISAQYDLSISHFLQLQNDYFKDFLKQMDYDNSIINTPEIATYSIYMMLFFLRGLAVDNRKTAGSLCDDLLSRTDQIETNLIKTAKRCAQMIVKEYLEPNCELIHRLARKSTS